VVVNSNSGLFTEARSTSDPAILNGYYHYKSYA
jgi:hypothetical protein